MQRHTIHFHGRVQGVGFRATVHRLAQNRPIVGYVRNTEDRRVELVAEGTPEDLTDLVRAIQREMDRFIKAVNVNASPATGEFGTFEIRQ